MKKIKYLITLLLIIIPIKVFADNDYTIEAYDVDIVVNKDNTYDITETITANFEIEKHGIIRKIPLKNEVKRLNDKNSTNRAKITNLKVSENYTTSKTSSNYSIKIGDADETLIGEKEYVISYRYNIGNDTLRGKDEFYFNLIGNEWDTSISNITFRIEMPEDFDEEKLGFSKGSYGSTNFEGIYYKINNNVIEGYYDDTLNAYQGLNVRLELDEGYFVKQKPTLLVILMYVIPIAGVIISSLLWLIYGRDNQVIETVEFYPPEDFNSLELAFAYKGKAANKDVVSLLIYLANKGYIQISELNKKTAFSKSESFVITKLKEYDGNNENEETFLNGLFKYNSEKITEDDLYNNFYKTMNKILSNINSKENKNKIFDKTAKRKTIFVAALLVISILSILALPTIDSGDAASAIVAFVLVLFYTPFYAVGFSKGIPTSFRVIWLSFTALHSMIFFASMSIFSTILNDPMYKQAFMIGIISIALIAVILKFMPKRTPYGTELLGKIKGFKNFLETAEKEKLESMVLENPTYFYDILPYTYVLGISNKWIKKFESITIVEPTWYSGSSFDSYHFNTFINNTMSSATKTMSSSPSSSSSGGFSSSSSSGGGSSGGGSGGGGGSSW